MKERGNQGQWWSSYNIKLKPWEINECYFTLYNILCLLKVTQSRGEKKCRNANISFVHCNYLFF